MKKEFQRPSEKLNLLQWPELGRIRPKVEDLWYRGNLSLLEAKPRLAIVGSRRMTDYGRSVIEKWTPQLVEAGVTIVSGMMYGVDQCAHENALKYAGKTIGVLGWGIDRPASSPDEKLTRQMEENGLLISEYEAESEARLWMFPARNRIVVGMSDAVWVVEAGERSGSLITANWARKMQVPLLALPGQIDRGVSRGTNDLIRSGLASMVTKVEHILQMLGKEARENTQQLLLTEPILELLLDQPRGVDELVKITRSTVGEVMQKLSGFELEGRVESRGGRYYVIEG